MKKMFIFVLALSVVFSSHLMAGMPIATDLLPKNSLEFIKKYFPSATIVGAEKDRNSYEVYLSGSVEIDFLLNGEWKEIKSYSPLPTDFIPANILNVVKSNHPDASIIEVEKKYDNYKIKLNNMMELHINSQGVLMKQKFDD